MSEWCVRCIRGTKPQFVASIHDVTMPNKRWNWGPPLIISVMSKRMMVAKTVTLMSPSGLSVLEIAESCSIAID